MTVLGFFTKSDNYEAENIERAVSFTVWNREEMLKVNWGSCRGERTWKRFIVSKRVSSISIITATYCVLVLFVLTDDSSLKQTNFLLRGMLVLVAVVEIFNWYSNKYPSTRVGPHVGIIVAVPPDNYYGFCHCDSRPKQTRADNAANAFECGTGELYTWLVSAISAVRTNALAIFKRTSTNWRSCPDTVRTSANDWGGRRGRV